MCQCAHATAACVHTACFGWYVALSVSVTSNNSYQDIAHNKTRVRALTTLEPNEFADLVPIFEACFLERMRAYTIDGLPRLNRRYTTYKNAPLPTIEDKLLLN